MLADSTGRGGRVDTSPPLRTGQFTLAAFVYPESGARKGIVATNVLGNNGNFALADSVADVLWFGTNANGQKLWDGRIDEVALFDRAFSDVDVTDLYEAAIEEIKSLE